MNKGKASGIDSLGIDIIQKVVQANKALFVAT